MAAMSAVAGIPTYKYLDSFGSMGSGNGQFIAPVCIALNTANGEIYVVDQSLSRVEHFDADGAFLNHWGSLGAGDGQFSSPAGVAVDPATGRVYVADFFNSRVCVFNEIGFFISKFGTVGGGSGQFSGPSGVAINFRLGQIYVSEQTNQRVQRFFLATLAYAGQWGAFGSVDGTFNSPGDVVIPADGSQVFVSDYSRDNVQKFDGGGIFTLKFGGTGTAPGQMKSPFGLGADAAGRIYVADRSNNRVQVFDAAGVFLTTFGIAGSGNGEMMSPYDVAVSPSGVVYVLDRGNLRIQRWQLTENNAPPVVRIRGKKRIGTTGARKTIRGSATDADGANEVVSVSAKVGKRSVRVVGTTSWKLRALLKPGLNKIVVTATDAAGATSKKVVIRVVRS